MVSDLSGRGVGMDVVRSAVEKINGAVQIQSELGKGTSIRISLPLSMAVTQVMVIESDGQLFGVPMDNVVETVRIPRSSIHTIKQSHDGRFARAHRSVEELSTPCWEFPLSRDRILTMN